MEDYRTEYYRGYGGYKFRWSIRKERKVLDRKVLMTSSGLMFCSPQSAVIIKGLIP